MKWPTIGLAAGVGLLVGEGVTALRGLMESFRAGGIGGEVVAAGVVYVAAAIVLDLAAQPLEARLRRRLEESERFAAAAGWMAGSLRALPFLALSFIAMLLVGINPALGGGAVALAALFAVAAHVRIGWPLAAGMAAVLAMAILPRGGAGTTLAAEPASAPGRSIALIVLDTVRLDRTSLHGASRDTTPNLDALAARGVRFDRAYATSCWSIPTHATLFTGLMPREHGAHFESLVLADGMPVLASLLGEAGWETAGFTGNPYISAGTGFGRGFATWEESWRSWVVRRSLLAGHLFALLRGDGVDKGGADVVEGIDRWLAERSARSGQDGDSGRPGSENRRPFFLFVNLMEAHAPYQDVPAEFRERFLPDDVSRLDVEVVGNASHDAHWTGRRLSDAEEALTFDLMDGATAAADHYLGEILERLPEETLVVVVSDHGELVGEHDLYGHMTSLHQELVHVPLVVAGGDMPRGIAVAAPVSTADVFPTLLAHAGLEAPEHSGRDLRVALAGGAAPDAGGETDPADRVVRAEHFNSIQATRFWSQHRTAEELASVFARRAAAIGERQKRVVAEDGSDLGYDLLRDPDEQRPFPGERTGLEVEVPGAPKRVEGAPRLDPAQLEALRSLGYVQ